jgi:hypothetical protein
MCIREVTGDWQPVRAEDAEESAAIEATFREARSELNPPAGRGPFLCECEEPACHEPILLTDAEYEHVGSEDERARRVGLNEAIFRQVNEQIRDLIRGFGTEQGTMSVICECATPTAPSGSSSAWPTSGSAVPSSCGRTRAMSRRPRSMPATSLGGRRGRASHIPSAPVRRA